MSVKISELTASSAVTSNDFVPIVDYETVTTKRASASQILDYITGSSFNSLTVIELTASNITGSVAKFTTISGSTVTGSTALFTTISGSTITGSLAKFTTLSASAAEFSGSVLIYGTASLSSNPSAAYIIYSSSLDKLVAFPGLYVSGNLTGSGLGAFQTVSASNYLGLPPSSFDLTKISVSSSVSLSITQRAVFAKNNTSSSVSVTLPSASLADSKEYYIIKADSLTGSVIISGSSPNLINGQATYELNGPYQSVTLIHDGVDWFIF